MDNALVEQTTFCCDEIIKDLRDECVVCRMSLFLVVSCVQ